MFEYISFAVVILAMVLATTALLARAGIGLGGFIGALIGSRIAGVLGLPEWLTVNIDGRQFPILWSILGATLFTVVIGLLTRGRNTPL